MLSIYSYVTYEMWVMLAKQNDIYQGVLLRFGAGGQLDLAPGQSLCRALTF